MIGRHFHNTEKHATATRMLRRRRVRRWVMLAGSISWGLIIPSEIVLSSDESTARSLLATVQVTAALPFSLSSETPVVERPHRYRIEDTEDAARFDVSQASSEEPVEPGEIDLSRRATELGQRMRERFFSPPAAQKTATVEKPNATPVAAKSAESTPVRAASNIPSAKAGGLPWSEPGLRSPKQDTSAPRSILRGATQPADFSTEAKAANAVQPAPTVFTADPVESHGMPGSWVLEVNGTHRIRVPQNVASVRVSNPTLCEVLQVGAREVVVIGKATGIAIVHLSFDSGAPEQQYAFRVSRHADGNGPTEETLTRLETLLAQKFPGRGIELQWSRESLVVNGTASDRQEAIQILTFVRDTYLVPVVDRLEVQRGKPGGKR